jgi:PAS domain S-box-containing protein
MTITEKILNLLEINENVPALVINEFANIVAVNEKWSKQLGKIESGKSVFNIFDKSTSLLVKSSLIDSKTFLKVKKRNVQFFIDDSYKNFQLTISPFKIENKLYFYILIFNEEHKNNLIIYPTEDDFSYLNKFSNIFDEINSQQDQKQKGSDFKYLIEIEKEPIAIKDFTDFKLMNTSFKQFIEPEIIGQELSLNSKLKNSELIFALHTCVKESVKNKSIFIIENPFAEIQKVTETSKILVFPIENKDEAIIFGKIIFNYENELLNIDKRILQTIPIQIENDMPTIIYDTNNFEILDVNESAAKIYGFDINELKSMSFLELFIPDDLQNLLAKTDDENVYQYKQITKEGNKVNIISEREKIFWQNKEAYLEKIRIAVENNIELNVDDLQKSEIISEEKIDSEIVENISVDEISELIEDENVIEVNIPEVKTEIVEEVNLPEENIEPKSDEENKQENQAIDFDDNENLLLIEKSKSTQVEENKEIQYEKKEEKVDVETEQLAPLKEPIKEIKKSQKSNSPFLSSLFHELLTPVNVILGFVQEIIDSVENPSEEQEESAKIIKENQQLLLQTMNTAVQFAKLEENILPIKIEEFNLKNYLSDIEDNTFKISDSENVKVNIFPISDIIIKNDRQKFLAAVSYLIKFVVKLTKSDKVNVSLNQTENSLNVIVSDTELGISEKVLQNILEIYNSEKFSDNNNLGLSQISIKLAKKLNEIVSAKVLKLNVNNSDLLALSIPINYDDDLLIKEEQKISIADLQVDQIEYPKDETVEELPKSELNVENFDDEELPEAEFPVIVEENLETDHGEHASFLEEPEIITEIDDRIIEDFSEEEIGIIETVPVQEEIVERTVNISELSCLFIDDSIDAQLLFKSQMNDFKDLKICGNFSEALPLLETNKFDVIYVDINLNDVYNGFDALKIIRQFSEYKITPVFAITAYPFNRDKEKFLNFGFTDYFVKPLLKEQLIESLEKSLF